MTDQTLPISDPADPVAPLEDSSAGSVVAPPVPGDDKKSPLDVLDQILNDAKAKAELTSEQQAAEEAKILAEERNQRAAADAAQIAIEEQQIKEMTNSPQYQSVANQAAEEHHQEEVKAAEMDGNEILQLGHTKL